MKKKTKERMQSKKAIKGLEFLNPIGRPFQVFLPNVTKSKL